MHSTLGELTDATNQALAFPIYGLAWPLGSVIGCAFSSKGCTRMETYSSHYSPLIGGTFSEPAARFPSIFTSSFWQLHPYFLPSILASCFSIGGVALGYFYLQEVRVIEFCPSG